MNKKVRLLDFDWLHLFLPLSLFFAFLVYLFRYDHLLQFEIIVIADFSYIFLAFLHHYIDKSLTFEVVIEYILVAVLSLVLLQAILL